MNGFGLQSPRRRRRITEKVVSAACWRRGGGEESSGNGMSPSGVAVPEPYNQTNTRLTDISVCQASVQWLERPVFSGVRLRSTGLRSRGAGLGDGLKSLYSLKFSFGYPGTSKWNILGGKADVRSPMSESLAAALPEFGPFPAFFGARALPRRCCSRRVRPCAQARDVVSQPIVAIGVKITAAAAAAAASIVTDVPRRASRRFRTPGTTVGRLLPRGSLGQHIRHCQQRPVWTSGVAARRHKLVCGLRG